MVPHKLGQVWGWQLPSGLRPAQVRRVHRGPAGRSRAPNNWGLPCCPSCVSSWGWKRSASTNTAPQ